MEKAISQDESRVLGGRHRSAEDGFFGVWHVLEVASRCLFKRRLIGVHIGFRK